jgi:hypothetical protein
MSPQNECMETVKQVMEEVMREKDALVGRLNAMHQRIAEEEDPVTKVRRKVEWTAEKERSVEALNEIVASLQRALDEEEKITHGSTSSLCSSANIAASHPPGASSLSFTNEHASSLDRSSTARLPARLDKDDGGEGFMWRALSVGSVLQGSGFREPASLPASKAAVFLRRISSEASLLPQQVRKSVRKGARKFSSMMLRRVGWSPALQDSQWVWEQRLKNGYSV